MPSVAVIATSDALSDEALEEVRHAADWAQRALGWDVTLGEGLDERHAWGGAGTPLRRAERLAQALGDFDAVMCAGGGDHAAEILDHLDLGAVAGRTFVGTSDNAVLGVALARAGARAFCGPDLRQSLLGRGADPQPGVARSLDFVYTQQELRHLFDSAPGWREVPLPPQSSGLRRALRKGDARGRLVSMNLRGLLKLAGTPWWPADLLDGSILLLEKGSGDYNRVVAELFALHQTGALSTVAAVCLGWLKSFDNVPRRTNLEQVVAATLDLTSVPVWHLGLFGHRCPHALLPFGAPAELRDGHLYVEWPAL